MYFCPERRLVYIRIPKCGSTSFVNSCQFWKLAGADHDSVLQARKHPSWRDLSDYKAMTVIRHPQEWIESFFTMCVNAEAHWKEYVGCKVNLKADYAFDVFMRNFKVTPFDWVTCGGELLAEVWRIEDLPEILERLGCKPLSQRLNVTKSDARRNIPWTPELRDIARERLNREWAYYDKP